MSLAGVPTTVLVAPDSFKGTLSAAEVAEAVARGLEIADWCVDRCPVADGGEGTLAALSGTIGGELTSARVADPLGREVEARFAIGEQGVAVVESAAASGLALVAERDRDAVGASTYGTGQLIVAAARAGAKTIYLGVGGSATTDGGAGAVRAIREEGGLAGVRLTILCDVRTPFEHAARVFGPQKGADPDAVRRLTARLNRLARRLPRDPRGMPMTGAAGGLAGGLWSALGAQLIPGAPFILDALDFDVRMRAARAVVTGEGRLDRQSLTGKAVSEVATRARQAGVPCHAIVACNELDAFDQRILDIQAVLEARNVNRLEHAGTRLAAVL